MLHAEDCFKWAVDLLKGDRTHTLTMRTVGWKEVVSRGKSFRVIGPEEEQILLQAITDFERVPPPADHHRLTQLLLAISTLQVRLDDLQHVMAAKESG